MFARTPAFSRLLVPTLLILFFLVRIAALIHFQADLRTDPDIYLALARNLSAGDGLIDPGTGKPTAFRPPLYPMLLTPFCQPDQVLERALLHLGLSFLTLLALWQLGKNLNLSREQIALAGLIYTFDPLSVRYLALPMTETLCTCLVTVLLMLLTRERQSWRNLFEIGVVFGLAVLSRPTFWAFGLIFGPLWLIRAWVLKRTNPETSWRMPLAASAGCVLAGTGLIVLPWLIRNLTVLHSPILMTTHGGYTLYLGNNAPFYREVVMQPLGTIWDGSHGPGQQAWLETIMQQAKQEGISGEVALDQWMSRQAKSEIIAHPKLFLRACLLKFCWFWNLGPQGPETTGIPGWLHMAIRLFYGFFWFTAFWGALRVLWQKPALSVDGAEAESKIDPIVRFQPVTTRKNDPVSTVAWRWRLILIFIGSLMLPHLLYWSDTRMRTPITPALALLAASLLPDLYRFSLHRFCLAGRNGSRPSAG